MKKILLGLISSAMILTLTGCEDEKVINVNIENNTNNTELYNTVLGCDTLIEIGDGLYYDSTTRVVYWWNGSMNTNYATTPSPYYAPNGLPYRYNPETNTFEKINNT